MRNGRIFQLRVTFFLIFVLLFGALGSWEGPQTLELMFGDERARALEATPVFWLGVLVFAVIASLALLFAIKKDLE